MSKSKNSDETFLGEKEPLDPKEQQEPIKAMTYHLEFILK